MTSEQAGNVQNSRCRRAIYSSRICAHGPSLAAAAVGNFHINRPKCPSAVTKGDGILECANAQEGLDTAQGLASEVADWVDVGEEETFEDYYVLVSEH